MITEILHAVRVFESEAGKMKVFATDTITYIEHDEGVIRINPKAFEKAIEFTTGLSRSRMRTRHITTMLVDVLGLRKNEYEPLVSDLCDIPAEQALILEAIDANVKVLDYNQPTALPTSKYLQQLHPMQVA